MKSWLTFLFCATLVLPMYFGCEPRPVVEQPPAEPPAVEQPAADVNPNTTPATTDEKTGVDVEVGGGQGVQGDVNETPAQQ
jgi:hypothetical protein